MSEYRCWHPWTEMPMLLRESRFHVDIERAEGSWLVARDGFRFLDGSAGLWNVSVGHSRREVIEAMSATLERLTYVCNIALRSPIANELACALLEVAPPGFGRVMFHCTGTAAVEGALLLVRQYFKVTGQPQRTGIVAVDGSYHGCSLLGIAVSGDPRERAICEPLPPGIHHIPIPDGPEGAARSLAALDQLVARVGADSLAAFVYEPIMGVAGVLEPPPEWTEGVIRRCRAAGMKIVADEVTTGLGRAGSWFASAGQAVDVIALGKGISGGYVPLAATLYRDELFEPFATPGGPTFCYGSTMDGYPAACAAGLTVLDIIRREGLVDRARALGARLTEALVPLSRLRLVAGVRGRGLMIGIVLRDPATGQPLSPLWMEKVVARFLAAGLMLHPTAASFAVLPPLTVTESEIDEIARIVTSVLATVDRKLRRNEP